MGKPVVRLVASASLTSALVEAARLAEPRDTAAHASLVASLQEDNFAEDLEVSVQLSGVEWSGVEWSGVEWSGVEWSGVGWSGVEWSGE